MNKFLKEYNKLFEQDDVEETTLETDEVAPETETEVQPEPAAEPEVETLSPESEVLLVRLIKKALVTSIDPEDVDSLSEMGDVNEKNARVSLTTLINIMKKYSTDLDIET